MYRDVTVRRSFFLTIQDIDSNEYNENYNENRPACQKMVITFFILKGCVSSWKKGHYASHVPHTQEAL